MNIYAAIYLCSMAFSLGMLFCYLCISDAISKKDYELSLMVGSFLPVINIIQSAILFFLFCCHLYAFVLDEIEDIRK